MNRFGFCDLSVVPVRTEPSDRSEMSTQLLFGDIVMISEQSGAWIRMINHFDDYSGWVDYKQVREISEEEFRRLQTAPMKVNRQLFGDAIRNGGYTCRLPAGCSFYDIKGRAMLIADLQYVMEGNVYPFAFQGTDSLIETAMNYLSCPYLWGGKTYLGLDCSGFTQVVYKQHGIRLLRDAVQQSSQGELISFLSDGRVGDLAFFDDPEGRIVHVGILLDNQKIIHCSGKVRMDDIDHQGIFNRGLNKYTHRLRLIRRVVDLAIG